ncbi:MAG: protein-disulfide reductase DsbD domain-containing protein [Vicinamibacteria bacterium]
MKNLVVLASFSLIPAVLGSPAFGLEANAGSAHVNVRLVPEIPSIQPGRPITVALHMTIAPGWHTYWRNPGDSGKPTSVLWTLPDGFKAGDLQWPVPARVVDAGLALYGYEGEVTFLTEITPGPDLPKGRFTLAAKVSWLECRDLCIPGKASLELTLPLSEGPNRAALDPASKALFASARASMPRADAALKANPSIDGGRLILRIDGGGPNLGSPLEFFPERAGLVEAAAPQAVSKAGTGWMISMKRAVDAPAPPSILRGVLVTTLASKRIAYDISAVAPGVRANPVK